MADEFLLRPGVLFAAAVRLAVKAGAAVGVLLIGHPRRRITVGRAARLVAAAHVALAY
ncbi:hypothetical protein [Micromonospora echinospora]